MRSINEFANRLSGSYATETNARKAFEALETDAETKGWHLVMQRSVDGRWVNIVVNPDVTTFLNFAHNGVGVIEPR